MSKTIQWALVLLSGLCFYFGFSLNGNFGWLIWIAPIPVLYISLIVKPRQAFVTRLSCLSDRQDELVFLSEKRDAGCTGHPVYHAASC